MQDGAVDQQALLQLEAASLPPTERPVLVGDYTAWARAQARTLRDRTFEHQPVVIKGQKPITIGHGYSTLGLVPETSSSWFLPLLHERLPSATTPAVKLAQQLKTVCAALKQRPLGLFDSEYGSGRFLLETQGVVCDLLFRLRPNRKVYGAPPPYAGKGRKATHGALFRLSDPTIWPPPDEAWGVVDEKLGPLKIQRWDQQRFEDAPERPFTLLRVERVQARKTRRDPGVIWLGYGGASPLPTPSELWRAYLSRYVIEHWYRFLKQSLHWTLPQLGTPEQVNGGARCSRQSPSMESFSLNPNLN